MELHREGGYVDGPITEYRCHSACEKWAPASFHLSDLHRNEKSFKHFEDAIVNADKSSSDTRSAEVDLLAMIDSKTSIDQFPGRDTMNVSSYEEENRGNEGTPIGEIESLIAVESSGKESTDSLSVQTIQDTIESSGFNKDNAENVEFNAGYSFISVEDSSLSCSWTSSSGQLVNIDTLEGLISKAKKDHKLLVEAVELTRSLRAEAGREEVAAQRAKEEAARGGLDILCKVEELRKMQTSAKETNDMRAGVVYGERGILAIEARELRSRLAQLSADKDKSFCMIKELQENLQARIDIAKKEKKAAEEETMRNEKNARKVLSMEEALMAKLSQGYLELLKEETNTKLTESIINCGHMVDVLKGEVSVLCENVKLLKEQMKGGIAKIANRFLNINLAAPPRCQDMDGHSISSNANISGSFSSRAHGRDVDISLSRFSTRSDIRDSQDAKYMHSSLCHTIDNEEMGHFTTGVEFNRLSPQSQIVLWKQKNSSISEDGLQPPMMRDGRYYMNSVRNSEAQYLAVIPLQI